jgi:hypothetical protein
MAPKPDSKLKPAMRPVQRNETSKVACFICGGPHYAKDCPPEKRKAARGYAARINENNESEPINDGDSDGKQHHSSSEKEGDPSPKAEQHDLGGSVGSCSDRPEGDQYDPDDANKYPFSSDSETEPVYSRATRIVATTVLQRIESRAAKASKSVPSKAPVVESNRARYKIGKGPQPQRSSQLQRCIEVTALINGLRARVLLDGGSNTNMISPEFATVAKITAIELQEQMTLQLAVTGSRSKINYGTWVAMVFGPIEANTYFDIANIDGYDAILGTPFLWEHGVSPIYENNGWVMKDGNRMDFPFLSSPARASGHSFWN